MKTSSRQGLRVNFDNSFAYLSFDKPQFGVSTGQAAVFYNEDNNGMRLLGGGWIDSTN